MAALALTPASATTPGGAGTAPFPPIRISTITWNGSVCAPVDFAVFYEHATVTDIPPTDPAAIGKIVWADFHGKSSRGVYPKRRKVAGGPRGRAATAVAVATAAEPAAAAPAPPPPPPPVARKAFDNQVTVIYKMGEGYFPNVKLFYNGNIHITGIRSFEDGVKINEHLVTEIRRIYDTITRDVLPEGANPADLHAGDFKIRMINSDFKVPFKIRRKDLHKLLISQEYGNTSVFQPGSYPGVKLQFFWNAEHPVQNGHCTCTCPCLGKGDGDGNGCCKKVTVAIFESGAILITGANAFYQITDAYNFIHRVLNHHRATLEKVLPEPIALPERPVRRGRAAAV